VRINIASDKQLNRRRQSAGPSIHKAESGCKTAQTIARTLQSACLLPVRCFLQQFTQAAVTDGPAVTNGAMLFAAASGRLGVCSCA
jgi:hypothetical protein